MREGVKYWWKDKLDISLVICTQIFLNSKPNQDGIHTFKKWFQHYHIPSKQQPLWKTTTWDLLSKGSFHIKKCSSVNIEWHCLFSDKQKIFSAIGGCTIGYYLIADNWNNFFISLLIFGFLFLGFWWSLSSSSTASAS